jgi:hypothetical protein
MTARRFSLLTKDEARIVANVAKLPNLFRKAG